MKFGVREICNVVFKANQNMKIGKKEFKKGQPVLYIDSAKTSTLEGAGTTVYATGGQGNARLIAWEGEKTLTFTVEDALISPMGLAILSGAGLFDLKALSKTAMVHCTETAFVSTDGSVEVDQTISNKAPVFITSYSMGSIGEVLTGATISGNKLTGLTGHEGETVFVDYYTERTEGVTEVQIDAAHFAGYFYVEASTLFRREEDGKDLPVEMVLPRVKIQSNFTFTMAATGDPSTFTFTMDAMPGYTMFEKTKKVLCAMQIIDDEVAEDEREPVTSFESGEKIEETENDSTTATPPAVGG